MFNIIPILVAVSILVYGGNVNAQCPIIVANGVTSLQGNSNVPCFGYTFLIANTDSISVIAGVIDRSQYQVPNTDQFANFNSCLAPGPGQPSTMLFEPGDTLSMEFVYFPNNMTGTSIVDLCFFDANNPTDTTFWTINVTTSPTVSVHEWNKEDAMNIFPVPVVDIMNIELPKLGGEIDLVIRDATGRSIAKMSGSDRLTFEASGLKPGTYYLSRVEESKAIQFVKQ